MAEAQIKKTDFQALFTQANWYGTLKEGVKNTGFKDQFVAFIRTDPFLQSMKAAVKTPSGRANLAKAFKDDELRGILLKEYQYYPVRWAVGDLYNSGDGRKVYFDMFASWENLGSIPKALLDIVNAMTGTKLPRDQALIDWKHYNKVEKELHAAKADIDWFKTGLGSDAETKKLLDGIKTGPGKTRLVALLRTQEIRPALDDVLTTKAGRAGLAQLLNSGAGRGVLGEAMDSAEGINVVGYIWNMPDGKTMMSEKGNGIGLLTTAVILRHQLTYNENQDKLKGTPARQ
ncbi:MAG: hypothetical protein PHV13_01225 [Candidatus ainarchaeum sp.]|nr:hypothetical protein [Candidatus ainarchaeum sp.]